MRDAAEFAADGIYMQRKQRNNQRRTDNAEQKCRQLRTAELDIKNDAERQNGDKNGRPAKLSGFQDRRAIWAEIRPAQRLYPNQAYP